jgi:hypothetical protein
MLQYQTFVFFACRFGGASRRLMRENGLAAQSAARQKEVRILCDF